MKRFHHSAYLAFASALLLTTSPALAGYRYVSKNGFATITFSGKSCTTERPTASYRFSDGTQSSLTSLDCSQEGGYVFTHRFRDTGGSQRCQGVMTMVFGGRSGFRVVTSWNVQGAVAGYTCSQTGRTFNIEMTYPPVQTRD
jgi:hypothetical protein